MNVFKSLCIVLVFLILTACSEQEPTRLTSVSGLIPDLEFELTDENNKQVTAKDYLGSTVAIFFGFTSCPEICPTTMHQLASIIKRIGEPANSVKVLFISVDPERDTTDKLKKYTDTFGSNFIGLRGEDAVIKDMTKRYRVTFGYGDKDTDGNYEVSHSGAVFIFDSKGKARLLATQSSSAEDIESDLRMLLDL
ncbi:MAG: cytochrome c oxidase assembly protein [Piscirickettsiaceae bacterium]|nr:MAG: cytochrome c oxidase assembly protein [Piscirickettsiaceae bacterium]